MDCSPPGSSVHRDSPDKNTGVSCHALQGIFPTQGSNPGLLHCRWILYHLSHQGSPDYEFPCCSEEKVVMVDYAKQKRLQGRFWKISSISTDTFLYSSSPLTNSLYHLCLFPQFPFGLHLIATHILPVVLERVSSDPNSQIQGVYQSLVNVMFFLQTVLSFLDPIPPLPSWPPLTSGFPSNSVPFLWVLLIFPFIDLKWSPGSIS